MMTRPERCVTTWHDFVMRLALAHAYFERFINAVTVPGTLSEDESRRAAVALKMAEGQIKEARAKAADLALPFDVIIASDARKLAERFGRFMGALVTASLNTNVEQLPRLLGDQTITEQRLERLQRFAGIRFEKVGGDKALLITLEQAKASDLMRGFLR